MARSPRHIQRQTSIAWMCLCSRCGDRGVINGGALRGIDDCETCPVCNGTAREPIPFSELFTTGRSWIPDWFKDQDEKEFK